MGVREMEKDQVQSGKTTDAGECRQLGAPRRGDRGWFDENRACRALYRRSRRCEDRACWNL
jgi:hypothetical protein